MIRADMEAARATWIAEGATAKERAKRAESDFLADVDAEAREVVLADSRRVPYDSLVVAVGKGKVGEDGKVQPLDVKKGDKVLFSKYAGTEVNIEDVEHLIIREDDVLGVVE